MKRVALIMHGGVAPPGSNQYVPAITGLVEQLSEQFDITVFSGFLPEGYREPFKCGRATVRYIPHRQRSSVPTFILGAFRAFRRDHLARPFSLVHGFYALPGGLASVLGGKLVGIPSVVTLLGGEAASIPQYRYGNMHKLISRYPTLWALWRATNITMLTRYQLDQLRRFGFVRTEGIQIIPFGADAELFPYVAHRPVSPPFHLLHIGHLNRVKDQRTLLKAFQLINGRMDCHLRIVGEGALEGQLRRQAGELGIADRVMFAGFVPHRQLRDHFAWAHLLLHTSLYEGQGVVFSEAAASGVPVCGTKVGLIADPDALFAATVSPGDDHGLAELVCQLLKDESRMDSMRCKAREWAAQHTAQWSAAKFAELYSNLIGRPAEQILPNSRSIVDR